MSAFTPRQAVHEPTFEDEVMRLWESDLRRLVERKGERFVQRTGCPACESARRSRRYTVHGLHHEECEACGALYVSPCPSEEDVRAFYEEAESLRYWRERMPAVVTHSRKERLYASRARYVDDQIRRFHPEATSLLEVGAGNGEMAEKLLAMTQIRRITLVEPQPLALDLPGVRVITGRFDDYDGDEQVDVVIAFEVLEHILNPAAFLSRVHSLLGEGGLFLFSTPNFAGFELQTLGSLSTTIMFDHVCLYTPAAIEVILKRTGFDVVDLQTPGEFDVQSVRAQYEKGSLILSGNPALRFLLEHCGVDDAFQEFLRNHKLSSHIKCVARASAVDTCAFP